MLFLFNTKQGLSLFHLLFDSLTLCPRLFVSRENSLTLKGEVSLYGRPPVWLVWIQTLCLRWIVHWFTCSAKSKKVKQEVSCTFILPLTKYVIVLCFTLIDTLTHSLTFPTLTRSISWKLSTLSLYLSLTQSHSVHQKQIILFSFFTQIYWHVVKALIS